MKQEITIDIIERWLKDPDWRVRSAAMNACQVNGLPLPLIRTLEPPATVYKKRLCGVIVCATIPTDAQVRGSAGAKCRASKATITDVIGEVNGVKVGISKYDMKTLYFVGDEVDVCDFDFSDEECSRGFHFFCTRDEAENY